MNPDCEMEFPSKVEVVGHKHLYETSKDHFHVVCDLIGFHSPIKAIHNFSCLHCLVSYRCVLWAVVPNVGFDGETVTVVSSARCRYLCSRRAVMPTEWNIGIATMLVIGGHVMH